MGTSADGRRVALVTGSGKRRLGWHVARALAERGYSLAIHHRFSMTEAEEAVAEFTEAGIQAAAFGANLVEEGEVRSLTQQVIARFGGIDVLVNCAGVWPRKKLEETTAKDVREAFEINTLGTFLCCQQVGLAMTRQASGGAIVNFGDWAVARPYLEYAAYFASKGAIETLTRCLAVELGSRNPAVRVNCVLPGPVMLPADLPAAEREEAIAGTLVKREGRPENVVQAVLHFIENDFVTGVCLPVDGGRTVYAGDVDR